MDTNELREKAEAVIRSNDVIPHLAKIRDSMLSDIDYHYIGSAMHEIGRLRSSNEEMRKALMEILAQKTEYPNATVRRMTSIAVAALSTLKEEEAK